MSFGAACTRSRTGLLSAGAERHQQSCLSPRPPGPQPGRAGAPSRPGSRTLESVARTIKHPNSCPRARCGLCRWWKRRGVGKLDRMKPGDLRRYLTPGELHG